MKAKVLMLTLMGACALTFGAKAQEEAPASQQLPAHKTVFNKDKAGDHWFMDIQGGAVMMPLSEANNDAKFGDRIGWGMPNLAFGKWISPYYANRVHFYGWGVPGFESVPNTIAKDAALKQYTNYFAAAQYEFMFDVVNYFAVYNPKRVFHFIPFVGVGVGCKLQTSEGKIFDNTDALDEFTKNDFSGAINAGLIFKFRLGRRVDLNLEAQVMAMKNNFAGSTSSTQMDVLGKSVPVSAKASADLLAMLTAGFSFNLGTPEFTEVVPMDWAMVNDLNSQISDLRAQNAELSKRPVSCPECPEVAPEAQVVTKTILNNIVYFRIGSAKVDQNQLINIYNTAEYAKNNNEKIYVTGYADEKTGSANWNQRLSELRANAVKDILVKQYGVDESRIVVDSKGCTEQPFERNEWNRVVIMTAE